MIIIHPYNLYLLKNMKFKKIEHIALRVCTKPSAISIIHDKGRNTPDDNILNIIF